jgi:uncharacterized protein YkwD
MNWIDLILILIMLLSILSSVHRGFLLSVLDLLCWATSLVASFLLYGFLSRLFDNYLPELGPWSPPLAFLIILVISRIILDALVESVLKKVPLKTHQHKLNKAAGVIPGVINGFLWVTLLSAMFSIMPISSLFATRTRESKLNDWALTKADWLQDKLSPVFCDLFNNLISNKNAAISESESVKLPFTVSKFRVRKDLEAQMLELVNKERRAEGLTELSADEELAVVARKHSADMFERGYFSHVSPEGKDPFARINEQKIRYYTAGENLALAQTLQIAHDGLMNSPGHRANILRAGFGRLGIGILDGGIYGLMITQNFRN